MTCSMMLPASREARRWFSIAVPWRLASVINCMPPTMTSIVMATVTIISVMDTPERRYRLQESIGIMPIHL